MKGRRSQLCASCCRRSGAESTGLGGFRGRYRGSRAVLTTDATVVKVPGFTAPAAPGYCQTVALPPSGSVSSLEDLKTWT